MRITIEQKELFTQHLTENERSIATVSKYIHDINCFEIFANDKEITKELVLEYKAFLQNQYEISSANSMIAALNSFFKFLGWYDCIVKQFHIQRKVRRKIKYG